MNGILPSDWLRGNLYIDVQTGVWTRQHSNMVTNTVIEKRFNQILVYLDRYAIMLLFFNHSGPYEKILF